MRPVETLLMGTYNTCTLALLPFLLLLLLLFAIPHAVVFVVALRFHCDILSIVISFLVLSFKLATDSLTDIYVNR